MILLVIKVIWWLTLAAAGTAGAFSVLLHRRLRAKPLPAEMAVRTTAAPTLAGWGVRAAAFLTGLLLALFIAVSFYGFAFTFLDAEIFFESLRGRGQYYPPPSWPSVGRFFPLAHQEFELLGRLDDSGLLYIIVAGLQLLVSCLLVGAALRLPLPYVALLYVALLASAPVFKVHSGLVFPERNLIFLLSVLLWSFQRYLVEARAKFLFLGVAATVPMLLYKETAFIFPATIGGFCLLGAALKHNGRQGLRVLVTAAAPMLLLPMLFLAFYALFIVPRIGVAYGGAAGRDRWAAGTVLLAQNWVWLLVGVIALRSYLLAARRLALSPLWDGLLAAGTLYSAANVALGLVEPYLHAPAVFALWCHALFIIRHIELGVAEQRLAILAGLAALVPQLPQTARDIQLSKEMMHSSASAARFIADLYELEGWRTSGHTLRLRAIDPAEPFEPYRYRAAVFANYVNARFGIPVTLDFPPVPSAAARRDERCINTEPVICRYGIETEQEDLALAFRSEGSVPAGFQSLFMSRPIGYWHNSVFVRVLQRVPDGAGAGRRRLLAP